MEAMIYDYNNRNEDASSTNTQVFEKTLSMSKICGNVSQAVQLIRDMLTKQNGLHVRSMSYELTSVDYDETNISTVTQAGDERRADSKCWIKWQTLDGLNKKYI